MGRNDRDSWERDFTDFLAVDTVKASDVLSQKMLDKISADLNPSPIKVFTKLMFIQFAVGLVTLLFCPQFGISLTSNQGLMPYLMRFGEGICMLGCGSLFTGLSLLAASFALKPEEVRTLKHYELLQLGVVATLSLGAFVCLGGNIVLMLGLMWFIGAIVGGVLSLEVGWAIRRNYARRALI